MNPYKKRAADKILQKKLQSSGAVLIEGAKWCGKTTTALNAANSVLYLQDTDKATQYKQLADTRPSFLLEGDKPRLLDEWQEAPVLWDTVRFAVDRESKPGQYILTGSAVPHHEVTMHTGTGRIARMLMRPMSLQESEESTGAVSLKSLFAGELDVVAKSQNNLHDLAFSLCRGGWPATLFIDGDAALDVAKNYINAVVEFDLNRVDGIEKDPLRVRTLLRSLARNISTLATDKTIIDDVNATQSSISYKTLEGYLNALRRLFVVEEVPAWRPSIRSKAAIRSSLKRQFVDPSLATALLHINPDSIWKDMELFGFLFESLCTRDVRVYADALEGDVLYYQDETGLEADLIVRLHDGRWGAIEVKMGNKQAEQAAENLLKLTEKVDTDKAGEPAFLMVLTGEGYAYRRKDGVLIVPIGCMGV